MVSINYVINGNVFLGDQVLAEFLDGLVQEHQRQDDLVSVVILT